MVLFGFRYQQEMHYHSGSAVYQSHKFEGLSDRVLSGAASVFLSSYGDLIANLMMKVTKWLIDADLLREIIEGNIC